MALQSALTQVKAFFTPPAKKASRRQPERNARKKPDDNFVYPGASGQSGHSSIDLGSTLSESQLMAKLTRKNVILDTQPLPQGNDSIALGSQSPDTIPDSQTTPKSRRGMQMRYALGRTLFDEQSSKPISYDDVESSNEEMDTLLSSSIINALPDAPLHADPHAMNQITGLQHEISLLQEELRRASTQLSEKNTEIDALRSQLKNSESKSKRQASTMTAKMDELQKSLSTVQDEVRKSKDDKKEADDRHLEESTMLQQQIKDLQGRLSSVAGDNRRPPLSETDEPGTVFFRGWWNPLSAFHKTRPFNYHDSIKEKELRGNLKSSVQRKISKDQVLIIDSTNYIKGFRYELYCVMKSAQTPHCLIHCLISEEQANLWNTERPVEERYNEEVLKGLIMRFEPPDVRNRWDSPLFAVGPEDQLPLEEIYEALFVRKAPPPNHSTQSQPLSSTNFLHELDKSTQSTVMAVMEAQKSSMPGDMLTVPGASQKLKFTRTLTLAELQRIRRQFISFTKMHPVEDTSKIANMFLQFMAQNIQ